MITVKKLISFDYYFTDEYEGKRGAITRNKAIYSLATWLYDYGDEHEDKYEGLIKINKVFPELFFLILNNAADRNNYGG